jgi:small-conductance mechanosensitive channel
MALSEIFPRLESPLLAGNTAMSWLIALVVTGFVYVAVSVLTRWIARRLAAVGTRTATPIDDMMAELLSHTSRLFFAAVAVWAGSQVLVLTPAASRARTGLLVTVLVLQSTMWGHRAISLWLKRKQDERGADDPGAVTTLQCLSYVLRIAIWSGGLLLALDNLGVDVTALVAGLGVGGVAVALAVQSILGDLFASLSIALDKPFVIGDFVVVGDLMGTIERVGLKTTRIRSLSGEQLVLSNSDLLGSRIRNFKHMEERRVSFTIGVTYQTPVDALESIPSMIRQIIEEREHTRFDRAHFKAFGDSAFLFEFVYYVLSADYAVYMNIQQAINLGICRYFADQGIEFAYPTQTVHLVS